MISVDGIDVERRNIKTMEFLRSSAGLIWCRDAEKEVKEEKLGLSYFVNLF